MIYNFIPVIEPISIPTGAVKIQYSLSKIQYSIHLYIPSSNRYMVF
jgi:hypothetical protein